MTTREWRTIVTVAALVLFAGLSTSSMADEPKPLPAAKPEDIQTVTAFLKT